MSVAVASLAGLSTSGREDLRYWETLCGEIAAATNRRTAAIRETAARHGIPEPTMRIKFYAWLKRGQAALVDRRVLGHAGRSAHQRVSESDISLVKTYCEKYQRSSAAAIRALLRDWLAGRVHTDTPVDPKTGYPAGWNQRNLMRYIPTKFELVTARIGRAAAASERRLVYTTRADLYVGSHYLFDDIWHDHFVNQLDQRKAGRPLEFHALDLHSACKFAWGMRVRVETDEGTMTGLRGQDMRYLLAYVLGGIGYSPLGTILVVEHGTAAISQDIESLIHDATGGLVTIARGGMEGAAAATHQWAGRSKGNFRFKAALESLGNLMHNEFAALPGQAGKDRDHRPEGLHGLLKYNDTLLWALAHLDPQRAAMLQWPILTNQQFLSIASEIYERINSRTEHRLEGWDQYYVPNPRTGGMRRMSPAEVWGHGKRNLIRIPTEATALLVGCDGARERTVRRGMIEMTDGEISGDVLRYDASVLRDGQKYGATINPYRPDTLWIWDAQGRFISALPRIYSVDRADTEAVHRACGAAAKSEAEALQAFRARHLPEARAKTAMHRHNASILRGEKTPPSRLPSNRDLEAIAPDNEPDSDFDPTPLCASASLREPQLTDDEIIDALRSTI